MFDHLLAPLIAAFYRPRGFSGIPGSAYNPKPDYGMNAGLEIDEDARFIVQYGDAVAEAAKHYADREA